MRPRASWVDRSHAAILKMAVLEPEAGRRPVHPTDLGEAQAKTASWTLTAGPAVSRAGFT
jgi:hypothetical protein